MDVKCPNCGKGITLVGARELKEEFGIGPNSVQHAREKGRFPEPWLSFQNRNIFLRRDIEDYFSKRSQVKVEETVRDLVAAFDHLPDAAREDARRMLAEAGLAETPTRRRRK